MAEFTGLSAPVTLSARTYGTLWDYDNRGLQHPTLFVDTPIRFGDSLERAEREVLEELEPLGLTEGNAPHPELRGALDLIANAETECYGWMATGPGRMIGAVIAVQEDVAVAAVLDQNRVHLEPTDARSAARRLVAFLPQVPRANGRSVNVRNGERPAGEHSVMHTVRFQPSTEDEKLTAILTAPRKGLAELNVACRREGKRVRGPRPIHVVDNDSGRWLMKRTSEWITATPADGNLIVSAIQDAAERLWDDPEHQ